MGGWVGGGGGGGWLKVFALKVFALKVFALKVFALSQVRAPVQPRRTT
jgi:hypothetical protein